MTSKARRHGPSIARPLAGEGHSSATAPTPSSPAPSEAGDGFLYAGNRHETVPRALLLDARLTPLERNAWQVFRLLLTQDGMTTFPTYDTLRPYLASMPCGPKASYETIARALAVLRLTRWLTLVERRRDPLTGRMLGNVYILHDEPLTPYETIQLDPHYLDLVGCSWEHASVAVRRVAVQTLQEVVDDPPIAGQRLPVRLDMLARRLSQQGWTPKTVSDGEVIAPRDPHTDQNIALADSVRTSIPHASEGGIRHSEEGTNSPTTDSRMPPSESEAGVKSVSLDSLRHPKPVRTVRFVYKENTYSTEHEPEQAGGAAALRLPVPFTQLPAEQQEGALAMLSQLDRATRQAVIDEWEARLKGKVLVRRPAGYLHGLIQRAMRGEFRTWAAQTPPPAPPAISASGAQPKRRPIAGGDSPVAREHIAQLRKLLRVTD